MTQSKHGTIVARRQRATRQNAATSLTQQTATLTLASSAGTASSTTTQSRTAAEEASPRATLQSTAPNKWTVAAIVATGVFMATLDSSIVNISLPAIAHYFGIGLSGAIEWVVIAYLVVTAATLLTIGRLADMIGRKSIWSAGLVIFTIGSALCGVSPSLGWLIAARGFQGLGGALLMAISPAMLTSAFPPQERGRALGFNAVVVALGVSAGPTLGGIITESLSWRWIFFVNIPIGIIAFIATQRWLTEKRSYSHSRFDPIGAVLLGVGLAALTLGLSFGQEWGWGSPGLIATLLIAVVAIGSLLAIEPHITQPLIDFSLFRNRLFASANVTLVLSFLALFAVSFMLPFYLEELRGFSTLKAGLFLTPLPLTIAVVAPISGSLADKIGTRWLATTGLTLACFGLFFISQLDAQSSAFDIIWRLMLTGAGQGLFQSPNNSALMGSAPRERQGVASGFLATGRVVGQGISVALAGAIFASLGGAAAGAQLAAIDALHGRDSTQPRVVALQHTFAVAFHSAFIVCACIAAFGVITAMTRGKEAR